MKKLLLGSIALTLFSISILVLQISCKKEATAQQPAGAGGVNQLGLIVYIKYFINSSVKEIWIANIDGTNPRKVPVNIPSELSFYDVKLSPNGKIIVFEAGLKKGDKQYIYSCSVDGTDLKKIVDFDSEFIDKENYSIPILGSVN